MLGINIANDCFLPSIFAPVIGTPPVTGVFYLPFNYRPKGGLTKKMKKSVFTDYLSSQFTVSETACEVMRSIKEKVTEELYYKMADSLQGFESELQVAIASNIRDAVCYGWERYTFINLVDEMLKSFYLAIDKELDRI